MRPITTGERLSTPGLGVLQLDVVQQRNWSRVASALDERGTRWFVKQFVTSGGRSLARLFDAEQETARFLASVGPLTFSAIVPVVALADRLVVISPFVTLEALDDLARRDRGRHVEIAGALDGLFADLLRIGAGTAPPGRASAPQAYGWKGLDIKNLAVDSDGRFVVFDFGPAKLESASTTAARLVASVLVADWGRSLGRLLGGPPSWEATVTGGLRAHTDPVEIRRALAMLRQHRVRADHATGRRRHLVTPIRWMLTAPYWAQARRRSRAAEVASR